MITWHYITRAAYDSAGPEQKTSDKLFYLSDTHEIYRGTQSFSESVILFNEEPETRAIGKLYINQNTLEGKIWNGTAWKTVIQAVQGTLTASDTAKPVSGKAVADYVASEISKVTSGSTIVTDVTYEAATNSLNVQMGDGSSDKIPLTNVAADLVYEKSTGLLQVKNAAGTAIGTGINLDLERFVSEARYDSESKKIILNFNTGSPDVEIDVADLVDTYTAGDSETIHLTVSGNQFTAEAIIASGEGYTGNLLQKTDSGLYVAPVDVSGKMDKDADATTDHLAKFDGTGNAVDAGVVAGGSTLAGNSASVLATEAAVAAIRDTLNSAINGKMAKVASEKAGEVLVATADGNAATSSVKVGGATMVASPNAATLATEAAVNTFVRSYSVAKENVVADGALNATVAAASDEMVPSEKAVVAAISWKTTV